MPWAFADSWSSQSLSLFACRSGGSLSSTGDCVRSMIIRRSKSGRRWSTICVGIFTVKSSVLLSSPPSGGRSTLPVNLRYLRDPDAHDERPFPGVMLSLTLFVGMFLVMIRSDPPHFSGSHHMSDSICLRDDLASAWLASLLRHPNAPAEEQRFLPRRAIPALRVTQAFTKEEENTSFYGS